MPADMTSKAVQLLDLMLDFFADDDHWARGRYHDRDGRHCLVGAVLHFSAKQGLPRAPVISFLEAALPRRQIGLIGFNDHLCRSTAELRSVILKARAAALENAEYERAAEAFKHRLLAEVDRDRAVRGAAGRKAPEEMSMPGVENNGGVRSESLSLLGRWADADECHSGMARRARPGTYEHEPLPGFDGPVFVGFGLASPGGRPLRAVPGIAHAPE
jgi:hypothetical protein